MCRSERVIRMGGSVAVIAMIAVIAAGSSACGGGDDGASGPRPAFVLPEAGQPVAIGQVPFPNDLFHTADGGLDVPVASLPFDTGANPDVLAAVSADFAEQGCFGPGGGVIFPLSGMADGDEVDPASLTADTVLLVDLQSGELLPVDTHVRAIEQQVFVRPARGHVLAEGATYAAVLTRDVTTTGGAHLGADGDLGAVLDGSAGEDDPRLGRAASAYAPLRSWLDENGAVGASDVAGATVFTTCDYTAALHGVEEHLDDASPPSFAVDQVWQGGSQLDELLGTPDDPTAPGVDAAGGVAHGSIALIAVGHFDAPNYQSSAPGTLGMWQLDGDGAPMAKGTDQVPVIVVLPQSADYSNTPVVVFQHGLGEAKEDVLAVANTLAAHGFATVGIDIPFHGARFPDAHDSAHNYTDADGPDGLTDPTGPVPDALFFDFNGADGITPLDPRVIRASFLQSAADVMALSRLITGGDWSALITAAAPALDDLTFRTDRIVYSSESFGGFVGMLALAFEPRYQAAFLSVAGGGLLSDLLENSPTYSQLFIPVLGGAFAVTANQVNPEYDPGHTHWAFQMMGMLLGGMDPLSYAHRLPEKGVSVVLAADYSDEAVPNQSEEALAAALGLSWAPVPGAVDGPSFVDPALVPAADLPLSGNVEGPDGRLTEGFFEIDPGSHGMITRVHGKRTYKPGFPPFVPLDMPETFDNPTREVQDLLAEFAESYVNGGTPEIGAPAPALGPERK